MSSIGCGKKLNLKRKIESKIIVVRGQRVILDSDLAHLYGVSTMRLNEQVTLKVAELL